MTLERFFHKKRIYTSGHPPEPILFPFFFDFQRDSLSIPPGFVLYRNTPEYMASVCIHNISKFDILRLRETKRIGNLFKDSFQVFFARKDMGNH